MKILYVDEQLVLFDYISCSSVFGNQQLNSHNHVTEVFKLVISISFKNHSLSERAPTSFQKIKKIKL